MGKSVYDMVTLAAVTKRPHTREAAHVSFVSFLRGALQFG